MTLMGIFIVELTSECIDKLKSYTGLPFSPLTYEGRDRSKKMQFYDAHVFCSRKAILRQQ
jgi:hypothetical protein